MTFDDQQINKILNQYKKTRERERKYYHEVKKTNEDFVNKNRERAKNHYETNKENKKQEYQEKKDFYKCKSLYYYYKRNGKSEDFSTKFPDKMEILNQNNFKF